MVAETSLTSRAISTSLPTWLCVSSEKPSSKLEGARRTPSEGEGASWVKREGETGAWCAMSEWRIVVLRECQSCASDGRGYMEAVALASESERDFHVSWSTVYRTLGAGGLEKWGGLGVRNVSTC